MSEQWGIAAFIIWLLFDDGQLYFNILNSITGAAADTMPTSSVAFLARLIPFAFVIGGFGYYMGEMGIVL